MKDVLGDPHQDNRAIAGLSMGGGRTLTATQNNQGLLGYMDVVSCAAALRRRRGLRGSSWKR